jgi:DNA-binding LytR/AlgR family response regulator
MHKIAICDDEKNVCSRLEELIYKFFKDRSERCEVEVWYDSDSLCHQIGEYNPDILFLDIELPNNNGVYVGKFIRNTLQNDLMNIVYISHNTSYALELFQIHPYDFLVKPVDAQTLFATLSNVLKLEEIQNKEFRYTFNKVSYSVPYGKIVYFASKNKTVFIYRQDGEVLSYYGKLRDILDDLPSQFVCIGKSYVINIKYLSAWKSDSVVLEDGTILGIAQSRRADFKKAILNYESEEAI